MTRQELIDYIDTQIYPNLNNEVGAQMVREALYAMIDYLGGAATRDVGAVALNDDGLVTGDAVYRYVDARVTTLLKWLGVSSTPITDGGTEVPTIGGVQVTPQKADVVLYNGKEFVWTGSAWEELGDETSWALKTLTITAGTGLTGGGDLSQNMTIAIDSATLTKIDDGETAYGWGDHRQAGYVTKTALASKGTTSLPVYFDANGDAQTITALTVSGNITSSNGALNITGLSTLAGGVKLTNTKRIWFGDIYYLELDSSNRLHTNAPFYSDNQVSSGGYSGGSTPSGVDLAAVWDSLTNAVADQWASTKIAAAHIPDVSAVYGYATQAWVQSQGYVVTSTLDNYVALAGAQDISGIKTFLNGFCLTTDTDWTSSDRSIPFGNKSDASIIQWYYADSSKGLTFNPNTGALKAGSFVKRGGTSSQFLKADGSVDSNTYLTTASAESTYVKLIAASIQTISLSSGKDTTVYFKSGVNRSSFVRFISADESVSGYIGMTSSLGLTYYDGTSYAVYHSGNVNNSSTPWACSTLTASGLGTFAGGLKVTTTKRVWFGDTYYIELDSSNRLHTNAPFYSDAQVASGGYSGGSSPSGVDLAAVWSSLTNAVTDQWSSTKIAAAHIPDVSSVYGYATKSWANGVFVPIATAVTITAKHTFSNGFILNTDTSWASSDRSIPFGANGADDTITWYYTDSSKGLTFNPNTGALKAGSFVKRGNSGGFLKADGTEDTSTYLTTSSAASTYVKLDAGTAEQTIKSSIVNQIYGVLNLWRATSDGNCFLGFSFGTTMAFKGGIGVRVEDDGANLYHRTATGVYRKMWDDGNSNGLSYAWSASSLTLNGSISGATEIGCSGNITISNTASAVERYVLFRNSGGNVYFGQGSSGSGYVYVGSSNPMIFYTNSTERVRILADGKTGFGTSTPDSTVHVSGTAKFAMSGLTDFKLLRTTASGSVGVSYYPGNQTSNYWFVGSDASPYDFVWYYNGTNVASMSTSGSFTLINAARGDISLYFQRGTTSDDYIDWSLVSSDGNLYIKSHNLGTTTTLVTFSGGRVNISGNVLATGQVAGGSASDARLKNNIEAMTADRARRVIMESRPVTFIWNAKAKTLLNTLDGEDIGLLAQEARYVLPQAVAPIWGEYYKIDYTKYVSPIIRVLQDHEERITELEKRLN